MENFTEMFKQDTARVDRKLAIGQNAAILMLALTSAFVLFHMGQSFFGQWVNNSLIVFILTVALVFAVISAVDLGLADFLPWVASETLKPGFRKQQKTRKAFTYLLAGFCVLQLIATTTLTYWSADDIGEVTVAKPDFTGFDRATSERGNLFAQTKSALDEAVAAQAAALDQARQDAARMVERARTSKGAEMARLASEGHKWAKKQIAPAIAKAEKQGQAKIEAASLAYQSAISDRAARLTDLQKSDAAILSPILSFQNTEVSSYQERKAIRLGMCRYASFVFAFFFLVCTVARSLIAVSVKPDEELHEKGKSLFGVIGTAWQRAKSVLLDTLDNRLQFATPTGPVAVAQMGGGTAKNVVPQPAQPAGGRVSHKVVLHTDTFERGKWAKRAATYWERFVSAGDNVDTMISNKLKALAAIYKLAENGYRVTPGDEPHRLNIPGLRECTGQEEAPHEYFVDLATGHSLEQINDIWPDYFD